MEIKRGDSDEQLLSTIEWWRTHDKEREARAAVRHCEVKLLFVRASFCMVLQSNRGMFESLLGHEW